MVPLVGGKWAEVRTVAIGTVAPAAPGGRPHNGVHATALSYFSRLTDHASFIRLAHAALHRRGTETAGTVVGVNDGADWEQQLLDRYRSDAVRVLDFPHPLEHLATAAPATFGAGSAAPTAWTSAQADALKHGAPSAVLVALTLLPTGTAATPAAAARPRDATFGYLEKRLDQLRYADFLAAGYPIGSGAVESANKLVVEARLKGSGMHWAPVNVNPMLALRTIVCSGRWDEAWPQICQHLRADAQARRAARRCQSDPPATLQPPSPPTPPPGPPPPRAPPGVLGGPPPSTPGGNPSSAATGTGPLPELARMTLHRTRARRARCSYAGPQWKLLRPFG